MISLQEMNELTENLMESISEEKQVISPDWQRRLDAYKEAGLDYQLDSVRFDIRCERAKSLGFQEVLISDLVEMLMGEKHSEIGRGEERQKYEYFYEDDEDIVLTGKNDCPWGSQAWDYYKFEKSGCLEHIRGLFLRKKEIWKCRFGRLNYLTKTIPYGVVLKIQEVKKLRLFNKFDIVAPIQCWKEDAKIIDPILIASIVLLEGEGESKKWNKIQHYFLAQW